LRIFPTYYLVLGVATALTLAGLLAGDVTRLGLFTQLFYLTNYYYVGHGGQGVAPGTAIYWSLAVEEHFYLVFPCVYLILRRHVPSRSRQWLLLAATCGVVLLWRCVLVYGLHSIPDRTYVATDTRIDSILFGCMLAVFGNPVLDGRQAPSSLRVWVWAGLSCAALLFTLVYRDPLFRETFRYTIQGIALGPLFIAAIVCYRRLPFNLLNLRLVRFIGVLSYSLYLVHQVEIIACQQWTNWHPLAQGAVALGASIGIATAIYYVIERPCARLRRALLAASAA
jgi:peptidoglycan/LPS O-acetylase OafA/YrhL